MGGGNKAVDNKEIRSTVRKAGNDTFRVLFYLFRAYFRAVEITTRAINPNSRSVEILSAFIAKMGDDPSVTIDDRIKKIDAARDNLEDAIRAIDDLRIQADNNKRDLAHAMMLIQEAEDQKEVLGKQLETLKHVASADTEAFRQIVGLSKRDVWIERFYGFGSGIVASVIASVIYVLLAKLF